ncbi:MAG: thioredoxin [Planctomycetes bacterium]|nr:thioredoxin [Planctomycetota bacterium]
MVTELNAAQFDSQVGGGAKPAVVDFYATWCGPCKILSPVVEDLARDFSGRVDVYKVNVDEASDLAATLGITGVPTLIFFKGGREVRRSQGAVPKDRLEPLFRELAGERA